MSKREMSVAGSFYPRECSEIKRYIESFNADEEEAYSLKARAMITPHAGYVFSGYTANYAYRQIDTQAIKRVVVIGPSHRVYLKDASIGIFESYDSPCGQMKVDIEYAQSLLAEYDSLSFVPSAHQEHSTETQIPFIQHYFKQVSVLEIVYGDIEHFQLVPLIHALLEDEENFVVISTDLSHFHSLEEANSLDGICYKAIENMDVKAMDKGCEACGKIGVKALIEAGVEMGMYTKVMDYRTSYDANLDKASVVGYLSALMLKG